MAGRVYGRGLPVTGGGQGHRSPGMPTEMAVKPGCEGVDAGTEIPALDLDGSSQVPAKA